MRKKTKVGVWIILILVFSLFIGTIIGMNPRIGVFILFIILVWATIKNFYSFIQRIKKGKIEKTNLFLSDSAIWIYFLIYVLISVIIDFEFFKGDFLIILFKAILGGQGFFFNGMEGIIKRRMGLRMGSAKGKDAIILGSIAIVISLVILMFKYIVLLL